MTAPRYLAGADAMHAWRDDLLSGTAPTRWPVGTGALADAVEIGPGHVVLLGGSPGQGKTSLALQMVVDALRLTPGLRCLICNVEMSVGALLDRILARLSGVELTLIRSRQLTADHAERIDGALATLEPLVERLTFLRSPFDLANVAAVADAVEADLLVLDYLQRVKPHGEHSDRRGSVDAVMDALRGFADAGVGILAVSAVGRSKDTKGRSSYSDLSLASFRESSELEYGSDSAFILVPDSDDPDRVILKCLKNRHGATMDVPLTFNRAVQRFDPAAASPSRKPAGGKRSKKDAGRMQQALADLWKNTTPAAEDGEESIDE